MEEPDDKRPTVADGAPAFDADEGGELIGEDVGGYVIEGELGRGGMGVVYAATHPVIGKRAAIKILKQSLSTNPATVERFIQEARAANQIGHPNIVDIFAFGTLPDGRSYFVMDLLQGEPLRKRVKRSAVPVHEAVQLLEEIASALAAAHDKGICHRDLKPDNVFLVENPARFEVKLLDFGLAKLLPRSSGLDNRAFRTATGAQLGTPDYMSPEQLRGSAVDHRTDIYALGVMAFEILTRSRPQRYTDGTFELEGRTFKQILMQVPGVPEELAELIEAMVARNPEERPSLTAMRTVLKRVRPSLTTMPALSSVRAIGSELSIGAVSASQLGARPVLRTPPTGAPTLQNGQVSAPSNPSTSNPPLSNPPTSNPPSRPSQYAGLRSGSSQPPVIATKLGVPPPPKPVHTPLPVTAAPSHPESKRWLVVGAVLLIGAAIALVVVLAG